MFEVIIPVKNRREIKQCVESLIPPENPDRNPIEIERVIICDGGTSDRDCLSVLQELAQGEKVEIFSHPTPRFNKSRLINQGILHSRAEYVLVSDADIIWNAVTLRELRDRVKLRDNAIAGVQNVEESHPEAEVLRRDRYTYHLQIENNIASVKIVREENQTAENRPGCGLICTRRSTLVTLGGYKEIFQGWGWEDRDLLMRAELLGFEIVWTGKVTHLSHSDRLRNRDYRDRDPPYSRNQNILLSIAEIVQQEKLTGDLGALQTVVQKFQKIELSDFPVTLINEQ